MFLGLPWNTWIALAALTFSGFALIVSVRGRADAKRSSVYSHRRAIFDRFIELRVRLNSASDQAGRHSAWVEAFHIWEDAKFLFPNPGDSKLRGYIYWIRHCGAQPVPQFLKNQADTIATWDALSSTIGSVGQERDAYNARVLRQSELWRDIMNNINRAEFVFSEHLQSS
jgi:hypothetical protein